MSAPDPLDVLVAGADRALDVMSAASEELTALRVSRRSEDGLVRVTADGAGTVVGIELPEDLSHVSATRLSTTIVTTASDAARDALNRRALILEQMQTSLSDT